MLNSFASRFERKFSSYMKLKYAVAVNSGSSALFLSLQALKESHGCDVLVSGFTLSCVPSAVTHSGMRSILVDADPLSLTIDLNDLKYKIQKTSAKILLLSHMRGHIADLEKVKKICDANGVVLVEDCAHAIAARFNGKLVGSFGSIACFSMQAFKQINGGEMGIICTDNPAFAAKMIINSGSYMNFEQHGTCPPISYFDIAEKEPNFSLRASEISAAVALPQLKMLEKRNLRWKEIYSLVESRIEANKHITLVKKVEGADPTPTSIQFFIKGDDDFISRMQTNSMEKGLPMKWFGVKKAKGYTSTYKHWRWMNPDACLKLQGLDKLSANLIDIRLPYNLTDDECEIIGNIVNAATKAAKL